MYCLESEFLSYASISSGFVNSRSSVMGWKVHVLTYEGCTASVNLILIMYNRG